MAETKGSVPASSSVQTPKSTDDVAMVNQNKSASAQAVGADITHPVDPKEDDLLARAQLRAPSLTAEFVDHHELTDEYLEGIAVGLIPPPPTVGPDSDLYLTPGGWNNIPRGVKRDEVGKGQVGRS